VGEARKSSLRPVVGQGCETSQAAMRTRNSEGKAAGAGRRLGAGLGQDSSDMKRGK
jgi:hypothetical protein